MFRKSTLITLLIALIVGFVFLFLKSYNFLLLNPQGIVALRERNLIIFAFFLSLSVVIPVFLLTFFIAFKYRYKGEKNKLKEKDPNPKLIFFWWLVPSLVILILAIATLKTTIDLDPRQPLTSTKQPLTIQVIALRWKWLFIYPQQNLASVNFVQFPKETPINFLLTADAPMNSFWIPQLGGQMYAMPGMQTKLNLIASKVGEYTGLSAEISGKGFSGMRFVAKVTNEEDFDSWLREVKSSVNILTLEEYKKLSSPSEDSKVRFYSETTPNLYNEVTLKSSYPFGIL
jgi:cytochrome o ubiquinol oxidase subunit 2